MAGKETTITQLRTHYHDWSPTKTDGNHKNSIEIEQEIDQTRHDMDKTMDAIGTRFHPKNLLEYLFDFLQHGKNREQARDFAKDMGEKIGVSFRDNPMPVILIGAGVGWLYFSYMHQEGRMARPIRQEGPGMMDKAKSAFESAKESVTGTVESAKGKAQDALGKAQGKTDQLKAQASEQGAGYQSKFEQSRERAQERYTQAQGVIQENPLAVGILALAAGLLAGITASSSRAEKGAFGQPAQELKGRAQGMAESTGAAFKETARTAEERALEEGVTPAQLAQKAKNESEQPGSTEEKIQREGMTPEGFSEKAGRVADATQRKAEEELKKRENNPNFPEKK